MLPGTRIGDNCVIGAGALVRGEIPSNSVAVGVPAKVVKSTDVYLQQCISRSLKTKGMTPSEKKAFMVKHFGI